MAFERLRVDVVIQHDVEIEASRAHHETDEETRGRGQKLHDDAIATGLHSVDYGRICVKLAAFGTAITAYSVCLPVFTHRSRHLGPKRGHNCT